MSSLPEWMGELGYYVFEECGLDVYNPTIAMELGETYTFVQKHRTNFYHRECVLLCIVPIMLCTFPDITRFFGTFIECLCLLLFVATLQL